MNLLFRLMLCFFSYTLINANYIFVNNTSVILLDYKTSRLAVNGQTPSFISECYKQQKIDVHVYQNMKL